MPDPQDHSSVEQFAFDPTAEPAVHAYPADQLIECSGCLRKNPPNRQKCLYCGAILAAETNDVEVRNRGFRKLEAWEPGFNVILTPASTDRRSLAPAANIVGLELTELDKIVDSGVPLPIARVETAEVAEDAVSQLNKLGFACQIVSDIDLDPDHPPVRIRELAFSNGGIAVVDFNTAARSTIGFDDLALVVVGTIVVTQVDQLEKKRRRGSVKLLDESATASDEVIVDIYRRDDKRGFRITWNGFDFSCIGADKGVFAGENMRRLVTMLSETSQGRVDTDYGRVRHLLSSVWEVDARKDARGIQRIGFGKFEFGNTTSTSNQRQFNRFSRLQWHLL